MNRLILLLFFLCLVSGCGLFVRYVPVETRMPVIDAPPRPILDDSVEFSDREVIIVNYARSLEVIIREYNVYAEDHNSKIPKVE